MTAQMRNRQMATVDKCEGRAKPCETTRDAVVWVWWPNDRHDFYLPIPACLRCAILFRQAATARALRMTTSEPEPFGSAEGIEGDSADGPQS